MRQCLFFLVISSLLPLNADLAVCCVSQWLQWSLPHTKLMCFLILVVPRSMVTSDFLSFMGGWLSEDGGWWNGSVSKAGEAAQETWWGLGEESVRGSSLMLLSVMQGDHGGDPGEVEGSCSRVSRKSSAALFWGLWICERKRGGFMHIYAWSICCCSLLLDC